MTDPAFDELASAHLDGATTPAEEALIAADPALQARVEELRQVRAAVASVPPADPDRRDRAITAALAAFTADDDQSGSPVPVTSLPTVARRGPSPRAVRVLGAAAAVVLLALVVPLLGRLAWSGDDDDTAATFESTGAALEGAPDAEDSRDSAITSTTVAEPRDLGPFDDLEALADSFTATAPQQAGGESATTTAPDGACPEATAGARTDGSDAATTDRATVDGEAVIVVVVPGSAGEPRTLRVFRVSDCALVATLPL